MIPTGPESSVPRVSVVIPTWDRAGTVEIAIRSVLTQSFDDLEVIVVDDGSTDGTVRNLRSMPEARLHLLETDRLGAGGARNAGAAAARGELLTFLDSDDEAYPDWLMELVGGIDVGADIALCGARFAEPDGTDSQTIPRISNLTPDYVSPRFLAGCWIVRRAVFNRSGGYDPRIRYGENSELALRLLLEEPRPTVVAVPKPLISIRRRSSPPDPAWLAAGARAVLDRYAPRRTEIPTTWASYHTLAGVDSARRGHTLVAARHFFAALCADPRGHRRLTRLVVSIVPGAPKRVWGSTYEGSEAGCERR